MTYLFVNMNARDFCNLSPDSPIRIFGDLTPCVPLSLIRRGGFIAEEGLTPLLNTPTLLMQSKRSINNFW